MIKIGRDWAIYDRCDVHEMLCRRFERESKEYRKACKKARKLRRKEMAKQGRHVW